MRPCSKTTFFFWCLQWLFKDLKEKKARPRKFVRLSLLPRVFCLPLLNRFMQNLSGSLASFLHSPAWVELPSTCFLRQEKKPGLERQLFWARCSHCLISSVQVKLHPEKYRPVWIKQQQTWNFESKARETGPWRT